MPQLTADADTALACLTGQVVTAGRVRLKCAVLQLGFQSSSEHSLCSTLSGVLP